MTENREQFRDQIRSIMISAALASDFPDNTGGQLADAAESVYAQAIRDLLDHIGGMTIHDDVGGSESTDKMLRDFAAERGINFGEE